MKIFEINDIVSSVSSGGGLYISDFFAKHGGFWKSLVIRNLQTSNTCNYRTGQSHRYKTLGPKSERPIQGWGSYFEVVTSASTPEIEIDYIGVPKSEAMQ